MSQPFDTIDKSTTHGDAGISLKVASNAYIAAYHVLITNVLVLATFLIFAYVIDIVLAQTGISILQREYAGALIMLFGVYPLAVFFLGHFSLKRLMKYYYVQSKHRVLVWSIGVHIIVAGGIRLFSAYTGGEAEGALISVISFAVGLVLFSFVTMKVLHTAHLALHETESKKVTIE